MARYRNYSALLLAFVAAPALADVHCVATPAQFDQALVDVINAPPSTLHEVRLLRDTTLKVVLADFPNKVTRFVILGQGKTLQVSGGWSGTAGVGTCPQQTTLDPASSVIDAARFGTAMAVILSGGAQMTLSNLTLREGQDDSANDFKPGCLRVNLSGGARLDIDRVRVHACAALGDPGGLQVSITDAQFALTNSVLDDLYADDDGAVALDIGMSGGVATVSNNTVVGADGEAATAAVRIAPGPMSSVSVRNNVIRSLHGEVTDLAVGGVSNLAVLVRNHYDTASLGFAASSAATQGDPQLGADFTPGAASILIDSGVDAGAGPLDFHGVPRVSGPAVDVGAVEAESPNLPAAIFASGFED